MEEYCCGNTCFGTHHSLCNTLRSTISSNRCGSTMQIFLGSPIRNKIEREFTDEDIVETAVLCEETDTTVYVHAPYVCNLSKNDYNASSSREVLRREMEIMNVIPGSIVYHVGKGGTIENVSSAINDMLQNSEIPTSYSDRAPFKLLVEIAAGQKNELGWNKDQLRHLFEGIDLSKVGLCYDTQHGFAAGMSRLQSHEDVVTLFDDMNDIVPRGVSMFHMNDSTKKFGARVDRHAQLGGGYIWGENMEGLQSLVSICNEYHIDMISETKHGEEDYELINTLLMQ